MEEQKVEITNLQFSGSFKSVVAENLERILSAKPVRTAFMNMHEVEAKHQPIMIKIDFPRDDLSTGHEMKFFENRLIGRQEGNILLHQFHEISFGRKVLHAMIVGHVGAGKSVTAKKYAKQVSIGNVEALKDIEMVHFISASGLQVSSNSTAFDLIFTQQIGAKLTDDIKREGKEWMAKYADKTLLVIDGLDQAIEEFESKKKYGNMVADTKGTPNAILANIFSGNIYPGMRILSTSRSRVYWNLVGKQRPTDVIALRGFCEDNVKAIVEDLCPSKAAEILNHLKTSPQLHSLCNNPLFLIYMLQVIKHSSNGNPQTESGILAAVMRQFSSSGHSDADTEALMKLAYHGMKDNRFTFTIRYIQNIGISMQDLKGPISTWAIMSSFEGTTKLDDLVLQFSHQSMQEIFASFYPFNFSPRDFRVYASRQLNEPCMEVVYKLTHGIVLNEDTAAIASKYVIDRNCKIKVCRTILIENILAQIQDGSIKSAKVLSAIHEGGSKTIKNLKSSVTKIVLHWRETFLPHVALSTIKGFANLKEVSIRRMEVTSILMPILAESVDKVDKFKVTNLIVYGETSPTCFRFLGKSMKKATIHAIEFDGCKLNSDKMDALTQEIGIEINSMLPECFFELRVLNDCAIEPSCLKKLVSFSTSRRKGWMTLVGCSTDKGKLDAIYESLSESNKQIHFLYLKEKDFMPTYDDVSCICRILQFVEDRVLLGDWLLTVSNLNMLRDALNGHHNSRFGLVYTRKGKTKSLKRVPIFSDEEEESDDDSESDTSSYQDESSSEASAFQEHPHRSHVFEQESNSIGASSLQVQLQSSPTGIKELEAILSESRNAPPVVIAVSAQSKTNIRVINNISADTIATGNQHVTINQYGSQDQDNS